MADVHAWSQASEPAVVEGAVKQRLILDEALLTSLTGVAIDVTFETGQGKKSGRYTGVPLWALLAKAQPIDDSGKNASLRHTLLITGRDGYAVALALVRSIRITKESKPLLLTQAANHRRRCRRFG